MSIETKIENGKLYSREVDNSPVDIGACYYCKQPVMASPGQAIRHVTITKKQFGEVINTKQYPTHKACRKNR